MANQHTHNATRGLGEVMDGCASCCDGVLAQLERENVSQDTRRLLEQARDPCRQAAEAVRQKQGGS